MSPAGTWAGASSEGDAWTVEVDSDCFSETDPFVVVVDVAYVGPDGSDSGDAMAMLSPEQAREMAAALLVAANNAEANNVRCSSTHGRRA